MQREVKGGIIKFFGATSGRMRPSKKSPLSNPLIMPYIDIYAEFSSEMPLF
jgi:hypothetical protein